MKLEAFTICVGYADFLKVTLPWNYPLFDRYIIGTSPDDEETRELCRQYGVDCILSEEHKRGGGFNKGRLINKCIDSLSGQDWTLHIDADIVLPQMLKRNLLNAHLQPTHIYGADRIMVVGWEEWQRLLASGYPDHQQHDFHCRVNFPKGFRMGCRWANSIHGYVPIGFFQLWHSPTCSLYRGCHVRHYPTEHNDAARTDVQFAIKWDRKYRALIPEVICIHLESEHAGLGANWAGRTTKRFEPPKNRGQGHGHGHGHLKQKLKN